MSAGPIWLAALVIVSVISTFYAMFYANGAIEAEFPGTQKIPAAGVARFFFLLGFRDAQRRMVQA